MSKALAGLYFLDTPRIRFGRDGRWYVNGGLTTNQRIADLSAANLTREVDGTYAIRIGNERAVVEVEDAAFVVTSAVLTDTHEIEIALNDGTTESLAPDTLVVGRENVMYCCVKGGKESVRFLRPAYYQLASYITEAEPGRFSLCLGDRAYPITIRHSLPRSRRCHTTPAARAESCWCSRRSHPPWEALHGWAWRPERVYI